MSTQAPPDIAGCGWGVPCCCRWEGQHGWMAARMPASGSGSVGHLSENFCTQRGSLWDDSLDRDSTLVQTTVRKLATDARNSPQLPDDRDELGPSLGV